MKINESTLSSLLSSPSSVVYLPFMHYYIEEASNRRRISLGSSHCSKCRKKPYLDDLVAKLASRLMALSDEEKQKLRSMLATREEVFLVRKENGTIKTTQIA